MASKKPSKPLKNTPLSEILRGFFSISIVKAEEYIVALMVHCLYTYPKEDDEYMLLNKQETTIQGNKDEQARKKINKKEVAKLASAAVIGGAAVLTVQKVRDSRKEQRRNPASNWDNDSWNKAEGVSKTGEQK